MQNMFVAIKCWGWTIIGVGHTCHTMTPLGVPWGQLGLPKNLYINIMLHRIFLQKWSRNVLKILEMKNIISHTFDSPKGTL